MCHSKNWVMVLNGLGCTALDANRGNDNLCGYLINMCRNVGVRETTGHQLEGMLVNWTGRVYMHWGIVLDLLVAILIGHDLVLIWKSSILKPRRKI